jgi:hypothetical protein
MGALLRFCIVSAFLIFVSFGVCLGAVRGKADHLLSSVLLIMGAAVSVVLKPATERFAPNYSGIAKVGRALSAGFPLKLVVGSISLGYLAGTYVGGILLIPGFLLLGVGLLGVVIAAVRILWLHRQGRV